MHTQSAQVDTIGLEHRAPFRSREGAIENQEAVVSGTLPDWLRGDLVRTCPAAFTVAEGRWQAHHWFDALGMLYAFRVDEGGIRYRQRMMETQVAAAAKTGRTPRASFGSPIQRGFWRRLISPVPEVTDNVNVNVVALGDERVALTEGPHQWAVDPQTLALTHPVAYRDSLGSSSLSMIAHPHFDFARGRVVSLATRIGAKNEIVLYEHEPHSRERILVGRIAVRRMPYIHAFGLTPRHAVVIGHPFDVNPLRLLWSNRGYIDHFNWRPEAGTTVWRIDRATGQVHTHSAPPGFVFHVVNTFEDESSTVIDLALYPDASTVAGLKTKALVRDGLENGLLTPSLVRWTLRHGTADVRSETLVDVGFEFPAIHYRRSSGLRHRVAWGARVGETSGRLGSTLVRLGEDGQERTHTEDGMVFGEPVFVARPGSSRESGSHDSAEDDGVVLSVGSHVSEDRSSLIVLDAATLELRARADVPVPIPLGFHGSFFRA